MAPPSTRLTPEALADIQGFVLSGYGHLFQTAYLFVQFLNGADAQAWVRRVMPSITSARPWPVAPNGEKVKPSLAVNIGFSAAGLAVMGLPGQVLGTFPAEFQEGLAHPNRSRILGDTDESDPANWELGGPTTSPVHAVLIVHAASGLLLDEAVRTQRDLLAASAGGVVEVPASLQVGYRPEGDHEHFGFHDGIAQPAVAGLTGHGVPTGEFVLGYPNHYGIVTPTPVVPASAAVDAVLPRFANPYHAAKSLHDLGVNGTYVVYRKLQQDVAGFWAFMRREAVLRTGTADTGQMIWLASKCLGRWPSGASLMLAPRADDPLLADRDDFSYAGDPDGLACPIGAHVRRSHPRDAIPPYPPAQSLSMSEAHRLLRRARVFGSPLFDPAVLVGSDSEARWRALLEGRDDGQARGIHFFCVNASIRSQFEFVQQTWCNNPRFGGLNENKDAVIGDNARQGGPSSHMTIPGDARGGRTDALPRFVTVKAGVYLFMPGMAALRYLGSFRAS